MAFDLEENWDILYLEYSTDSGLTWSLLGTANDPNWYNNNTQQGQNNTCFNCPGEQWTGIDANLTEYKKDLTEFTDESNFIFRYVFHSDFTVTDEGAIIDNIVTVSYTHLTLPTIYSV